MKKVEDEFTSKEEEKEKDDGGMGKTPVDICYRKKEMFYLLAKRLNTPRISSLVRPICVGH